MSSQSTMPISLLPPSTYHQQLRKIGRVSLTAREVDVTACIIGGRTTKKIGQMLALTPKTIDNYIRQIYLKLACNSRDGLIDSMEQMGLHTLFKQHYFYLKIAPLFQQMLADVSQLHHDMDVLLIKPADSPIITALVDVCVKMGLKVVVSTVLQAKHRLATLSFTHVIVAGFHAHVELEDCLYSQHAHACWLWIGPLFPNGSLNAVKRLDLNEHQHFYSWMTAIMQWLVPTYETHPFQTACARIMGHVSPAASSTPMVPTHSRKPVPGWFFIIMWCNLMVVGAGVLGRFHQHSAVSRETHIAASSTWNLPFLMSYYTKRPELTQQIWNQLQKKPGKGTVSLVGLRGMGGVGKTTLAIEAIHYPKQPYVFRGWFRAETSELLKTDYLDLGAKMHLFTQQMNDKQKIIAVKEWLQTQPSSLLVYDNAPDMNVLRRFLPNRGHILITSRNQHMPKPIDVSSMTKE